MNLMVIKSKFFIILALILFSAPAFAGCEGAEKSCVFDSLENTTQAMDAGRWRDQSYRELAKSLASDGQTERAVGMIKYIENPDTQALTIRGIGMNAAKLGLDDDTYRDLFTKLQQQAQIITHAPSYGIAQTYIAMAQSYAGLDEDAFKTANVMQNESLRHKAFGEVAEIQANQGKSKKAFASLRYIESLSFRNKAYRVVSLIFAQRGDLDSAYYAAMMIENLKTRAESLQAILDEMTKRKETADD